MKEITKSKRVARRIVCFILCFITGLIGITGCDKNTPIIPGAFYYYDASYIEIDSAVACCGIDSFFVHSEWLQTEVNNFLKDSVTLKKEFLSTLKFSIITDNLGDNYIRKYPLSSEPLLYNCEGSIIRPYDANKIFPVSEKIFIDLGLGYLSTI